jgi:hypothetical protein
LRGARGAKRTCVAKGDIVEGLEPTLRPDCAVRWHAAMLWGLYAFGAKGEIQESGDFLKKVAQKLLIKKSFWFLFFQKKNGLPDFSEGGGEWIM